MKKHPYQNYRHKRRSGRIRIGILSLAAGWALSSLYHGHFTTKAQAQDMTPTPQTLDIVCKFDFPALPVSLLGNQDKCL